LVVKILKGNIFGMPRWLFFILLAVGLAIGIYLRRRSTAAGDAELEAEDYGGDYGEPVGTLPTDDPGLAGAGIVTQPAAGVIPVTTPYIPEGLTEIVGTLTGGLVDVATMPPPDAYQTPVDVAPPPAVPATGGGPPKRRPHTKPKKAAPKETRARYLSNLAAIRKRHGANSPEVRRFRQRHPSGRA